MLGELRGEKKQRHLIYSSIRMEINGLCLSDTPPLSALTFFSPYRGNSAHHRSRLHSCKVDTSRGVESHCCSKHCCLQKSKWYDNTCEAERLLFLRKKTQSQEYFCETRFEQFVYEEEAVSFGCDVLQSLFRCTEQQCSHDAPRAFVPLQMSLVAFPRALLAAC